MNDRPNRNGSFERWHASSWLQGGNAPFIEALYEQYLDDPDTVDPAWRCYFDELLGRAEALPEPRHSEIQARLARQGGPKPLAAAPEPARGATAPGPAAEKQAAVLRLINAYRFRGHQAADVDPLLLRDKPELLELDPAFHGLAEADMDTAFHTGSLYTEAPLPLRELLSLLRETYTGRVGSEYMHITDTAQKRWLQERLEGTRCRARLSPKRKHALLERLTAAEGIEKYLHAKYVGQKRFSLEGAETVIPLLDDLIQGAGADGIKELTLGMAHRGRLNILVNVLGKELADLFAEFEGGPAGNSSGSGDVKYHLGFSSDIQTPGGPLHVVLAFNPSHLEIVDPVVEGSARARMQRRHDQQGDQVLPVLIHGDASFAGQGVVMETFQLSQARGFFTGGTVHVVINNQIGFTTSHPLDVRSSAYSTEVAKVVQAPIFHVNGDDPEAVAFVTDLALAYRQAFRQDVVIDLVCYRRHGHNEADEPAATQPVMYQKIRDRTPVRQLYADQLVAEGLLSREDAEALTRDYRDALDAHKVVARNILTGVRNDYAIDWKPWCGNDWRQAEATAVPRERISALQGILGALPAGFQVHERVAAILESRRKMAAGALPVDWGFAENLAYAALLQDGFKVRLTGQDSGRGTFFHRHSVLHDQRDGRIFVPLKDVTTEPHDFTITDSLLSEEAVLGFEYGYATADPHALVIWEAQYGDFANGAQVVIDQFIAAGEAKWGRLCRLTLFLPHGYEGQGPEHSSGRLERYLQLCAEDNIQVCVPSTPAQLFHMLRRQMLRAYCKPLVVFMPKSLLRHKLATSSLDDLTQGTCRPLIDEIDDVRPKACRRVILCSGKVYYDLLEARRHRNIKDIAIIRIEQLYPFPERELQTLLTRRYRATTDIVWCQEEPRNQGAWYQSNHHFRQSMAAHQQLRYIGRKPSASPAVGYPKHHQEQQRRLVDEALS